MGLKLLQYEYRQVNWGIEELFLRDTNLIVGLNSSGKTRICKSLELLSSIVAGNQANESGSWQLVWQYNEETILVYRIFISKSTKEIKSERLFQVVIDNINDLNIGHNQVIEFDKPFHNSYSFLRKRNDENGYYKTDGNKNEKTFIQNQSKPLIGFLWVQDSHPELFSVKEWFDNIHGFYFGTTNNQSQEGISKTANQFLRKTFNFSNLAKQLSLGKLMEIGQVLDKIGFNVADAERYSSAGVVGVRIRFRDFKSNWTYYHQLSQGMFRSLYLLMYINYLILERKPQLIVIDDLGEGLDYEKSKGLGKVIMELCKQNNVQLLITTNDNFLMNVVPIKDWNIIQDADSDKGIKLLNYTNAKSEFDEFEMLGLSNFDMISSNFLKTFKK